MRAMVVSYACHVLHLSWKTIMHPLAQLFIDYEPGIHISQLQMQAGVVGINTIRIYNPSKQLIDYDPNAIFVKKWVPELRIHSSSEILDHEKNPLSGYPLPRVSYAARVERTKRQLYGLRGKSETKAAAQLVLTKHGSRMKAKRSKAKPVTISKQLTFEF